MTNETTLHLPESNPLDDSIHVVATILDLETGTIAVWNRRIRFCDPKRNVGLTNYQAAERIIEKWQIGDYSTDWERARITGMEMAEYAEPYARFILTHFEIDDFEYDVRDIDFDRYQKLYRERGIAI